MFNNNKKKVKKKKFNNNSCTILYMCTSIVNTSDICSLVSGDQVHTYLLKVSGWQVYHCPSVTLLFVVVECRYFGVTGFLLAATNRK